MFYTYAHTKPDGTIFYIGKGTARRAWKKTGRNQHWKNVVTKHKNYGIEILANWDTEQEAFNHEILLIECFKDLGCKLVNMSEGGGGSVGYKHTNIAKEKISAANLGVKRSDETKAKISKIVKGRSWPKESKDKITKGPIESTCIATGKKTIYFSLLELKSLGFSIGNVSSCINNKRKTHKGFTFKRIALWQL